MYICCCCCWLHGICISIMANRRLSEKHFNWFIEASIEWMQRMRSPWRHSRCERANSPSASIYSRWAATSTSALTAQPVRATPLINRQQAASSKQHWACCAFITSTKQKREIAAVLDKRHSARNCICICVCVVQYLYLASRALAEAEVELKLSAVHSCRSYLPPSTSVHIHTYIHT